MLILRGTVPRIPSELMMMMLILYGHSFTQSDNMDHVLSLMHLNVRTVPKNCDSLTSYLHCLDAKLCSIIGSTKTWHTSDTVD